jgi:hypothetical protein
MSDTLNVGIDPVNRSKLGTLFAVRRPAVLCFHCWQSL